MLRKINEREERNESGDRPFLEELQSSSEATIQLGRSLLAAEIRVSSQEEDSDP